MFALMVVSKDERMSFFGPFGTERSAKFYAIEKMSDGATWIVVPLRNSGECMDVNVR